MPGEDDFDAYLNEVSGEDVTSGQSDTFRPEPATPTGQAPDFGDTGTPAAKSQTPAAKTKDAPSLPTGKPTAAKLRPHVLGGFVNDEGDIVDEKGAVIAQKGTVRRVYEENGRLKQRLAEMERVAQDSNNRMRELTGLSQYSTRYGLDNDDLAKAMDMAGRVKRGDVLTVAKELVAMAAAQGHNVSDIIGSDVGDAVDMSAIKQMLESHLGPLAKVRADSAEETRVREAATVAMNKFLDDNPYADLHQFEIATISRESKITPQKAYNNLADFARRHQLDFSQPLEAQIRERAMAAQNTGQPTGLPATRQKPMPNGAAVTNGQGMQEPAPVYADPNDDWGTIIRDAQKSLRQ